MRHRLWLFVILALDVAWGITKYSSNHLSPILLETSEATAEGCVPASQPGTCVPLLPQPYICGKNQCIQRTANSCEVPGMRSDKFFYKSNDPCGCTCTNTTIWHESASCKVLVSCIPQSTPISPPPPLPPPCPWGEWSAWGPCQNPDGSIPMCDYVTGFIPQGIQTRTRTTVAWTNCTGQASQVEPKTCSPHCEPRACDQTAWWPIAPCPECWNRDTDPFGPPVAIDSSAILAYPMFGGAACVCPLLIDGVCYRTTDCQIPLCPRDCEVSEWTDWCPCDKSCVETRSDCLNCVGIQYRTREVITQPQDGGKACPFLKETRSCNETPCPIDCQLSTWSSWNPCTAKCGGGQRLRTRYILVSPQYNGTVCGDLYEYEECGTDPCPVSCQMGPWGPWDRDCPSCVPEGTSPGIRTKTRSVTREAEHGGSECPADSKSENCPTNYCPIDCVYTPWTDWTECSATCGGGIRQRFRTVRQPGRHGGIACTDTLSETESCNTKTCPVDCVYYWGPYHAPGSDLDCSLPCGGGEQQRDIHIVVQPTPDGVQCPPSPEKRPCNTLCCPQHCEVGEWDRTVEECQTKPEFCGLACGDAFCARRRNVTTRAKCGGSICPELTDYVPCKVKDCPATCLWSEWSGWSLCPPCGEANPEVVQTRTRVLLTGDAETCSQGVGATSETRQCPLSPCPVDCIVSPWVESPCSVTCGVGVITKTRGTQGPWYGGAKCPYVAEFASCIMPPCEAECVVSEWSAWGPCSATCHIGLGPYPYQTRTRTILVNSPKCSQELDLSQKQDCNIDLCPVDCILSDWALWEPEVCGLVDGQQHCGLNIQRRHRSVITPPANGGRICQVTDDEQYCQGPPCEQPCEFSPWSEWEFPSVSCNADPTRPAQVRRTRFLLNSENADGSSCPHITEAKNADILPCPVDCLFYYDEWSPCSPQGYRRRNVIITQYPSQNPPGRPCPKCRVERDDCIPPQPADDECWLENCVEPIA